MTTDRSKLPRLVGGPPSEPAWRYALAGALLSGGPVWHYLWVERYPARGELWLLVVGSALAGAVGALVARRVGGLVGTLGFAALMYAFVDLQADVETYTRLPVRPAHALALALAIVIAAVLRRHRATIACLTLGAFYLSSLPRSSEGRPVARAVTGRGAGDPALPVLLHVILDEQWGVNGLLLEGDTATAAFLSDFYGRRGFEVYPAAYSRMQYTAESVPTMIGLGERTWLELRADLETTSRDGFTYRLAAVPYFERLRALGYSIRVFQTAYVDFCSAPASPVASCDTQSGNTIANIAYVGGSAITRARLVAGYFLNLESRVYVAFRPDREVARRASVGGGRRALRHLRDAIERGPRGGVAYFAHVLAPHRPIEVDAECRVLQDLKQRIGYRLPLYMTDSAWKAALALEAGQIRCAHRELGAVLDALDRRAGRERTIVIVHGDHGGRIFQHNPKKAPPSALDDRQLGGRYSTLLAVRRPGAPAGVVRAPVPVQEFLWRFTEARFSGGIALDFRHYVLASPEDSVGADTLRALTPGRMPWER